MHHLLSSQRGESNLLKALKDAGYFVFWAGKNDLIAGQEDPLQHCSKFFEPSDEDFERWGLTRRPSSHEAIEQWRSDPKADEYYSFLGGRLESDGEPVYADPDWACVLAAEEFVREYQGDQPLCVFLPLLYPHPPFLVEEPWYSTIDRASLPDRIATPSPAELAEMPLAMKGLLDRQGLTGWDEARWTEMRALYYGMCARVDHQFGRVCAAFKERGIYDRTATFFFSDHGEYAGDYGIVEKAQNLFQDDLVRVPFLLRPPVGVPCRPGISDALVELVDFPATVCDLAGIDLGHHQFGQSLLPVISGEVESVRDTVFCEGGRMPGEREASEAFSNCSPSGLYFPRMDLQQSEDPFYHGKGVMARTATHKLVYRSYEKSELYDLAEDPEERVNRIDDPELAAVKAELEARLLRWLVSTGDVVPREPDERAFRIQKGFAPIRDAAPSSSDPASETI